MLHPTKTPLRALLLAVATLLLAGALPGTASAATGSISGTVRAAGTNDPVRVYTVQLYDADQRKVRATCTDPNGDYRFSGLATGDYEVQFSGDPTTCIAEGYEAVWWRTTLSARNATPIPVTDGVATGGIDATLRPEGTLSGVVRDSDTLAPIPGITVEIVDVDGSVVAGDCTQPDGTYQVRRLGPLPYVVRFVADNACGRPGSYPTRYYRSGSPAGTPSPAAATSVSPINGADVGGIGVDLSLSTNVLRVTTTGSGSVADGDGSIACPGTCTATRHTGDVVALTATPQPGFAFAGWSGACTGAGACTVTLDTDRGVRATFVEAPAPDGGGGTSGGGVPGGGGAPGGGGPGGTTTTPTPATTTPVPVVVPPTTTLPAPATPKAACRLGAPSRVRAGAFRVAITCDRRATLVLGGRVTFRRGTKATSVGLTPSTRTGARATVSVRLPAKVRRALKAKRRASVTLTLSATTDGGRATVAAKARRLR